jgi:hypothetical protein
VLLHPKEALLQKARAFQKSAAFSPYRKLRQVAEHRLARLMQLGMRQARYFGRTKTLCQLLLAVTVANLTLIATKVGLIGGVRQPNQHPDSRCFHPILAHIAFVTIIFPQTEPPLSWSVRRRLAFRPGF